MKKNIKKLLAVVIVAALAIAAIPFGASAYEPSPVPGFEFHSELEYIAAHFAAEDARSYGEDEEKTRERFIAYYESTFAYLEQNAFEVPFYNAFIRPPMNGYGFADPDVISYEAIGPYYIANSSPSFVWYVGKVNEDTSVEILTLKQAYEQGKVNLADFADIIAEHSKIFTDIFNNNTGYGILGDADGNGDLSIGDATEIQRNLVLGKTYLTTVSPYSLTGIMDYNGDGEIAISDATDIQKNLAKLEDLHPLQVAR
jgi:hypothetical protein